MGFAFFAAEFLRLPQLFGFSAFQLFSFFSSAARPTKLDLFRESHPNNAGYQRFSMRYRLDKKS